MPLEDDLDLQRRVQAMLNACEITNVTAVQFAAERFNSDQAVQVKYSSETSYIANDEVFANRFSWHVDLLGDDADQVATISAVFVVEYEVSDAFVPDQEAAEAVAESTGFFAAYPYARELFQSACARLQLNPLVLGMLMPGTTQPRTISAPVSRD